MRLRTLFPVLAFCISTSADTDAAVPMHLWSKGLGAGNPDGGYSVALDASDNVIMTGVFGQCVDFGGGFPYLCGTGLDMFLAKYDASGAHLWSKMYIYAYGWGVAVDTMGNIITTGTASGPVDFGGGPLLPNAVSVFIAKFDPNGTHLWSRRFGTTGVSTNGKSVAVDAAGNVVVAGDFEGTVNFGGGPLTSAGNDDVFVAKYDADGNHLWSKRFGGVSIDQVSELAVDGFGNVVITGTFYGSINFGGGSLVSAGSSDAYVVKLDPSGIHQWSKRFGSTNEDFGQGIDADGVGDVIVTGAFRGTVNFGGGPLSSATANHTDMYLAKYNTAGTHQWSRRFGGIFADIGTVATLDNAGKIFFSGIFFQTADFGGGPFTSAGDRDMVIARYDASGVHEWSQRAGGIGDDISEAMAADLSNNVLVTGYFEKTVDFGGGPITSGGFQDIFLAKYGEELPVPVLISDFHAMARGSVVDIEWDIASTEALDGFTLYRREGSASVVITTGDPLATRAFTDASVMSGKTYEYELVIHAASGDLYRSPAARVTIGAVATALGPNYPNPFNPKTSIDYTLGERMDATIEIFDVSGSLVRRLEQGIREPGRHRVEWDGRDAAGRSMGSGMYFYRMAGVPSAGARKMILLK